jgi:ribosomal protein L18E
MKVQHKYQEEIRKIEEEHKIAQLNLTLSRRSRKSIQLSDSNDSNDSNDNIVITGKNLQIEWEILNMEEIEI